MEPQAIQAPGMGSVLAVPLVRGLHHRYERRGCLKAPESVRLRAAYPRRLEISVRTVLLLQRRASANFVHQTEAGPQAV